MSQDPRAIIDAAIEAIRGVLAQAILDAYTAGQRDAPPFADEVTPVVGDSELARRMRELQSR